MASFTVLTSAFASAKKQSEIEKRIRSIKNDPNRSENGINNNNGNSRTSASNSPASSPKLIYRQQSLGTNTSTTSTKQKSYRRAQSSSVNNLFKMRSPSSQSNSPVSSPRRQRTQTMTTTNSSCASRITEERENFQTDSELFMMYRSCSRYNAPRRSISAPTLSPLLKSTLLSSTKETS